MGLTKHKFQYIQIYEIIICVKSRLCSFHLDKMSFYYGLHFNLAKINI